MPDSVNPPPPAELQPPKIADIREALLTNTKKADIAQVLEAGNYASDKDGDNYE